MQFSINRVIESCDSKSSEKWIAHLGVKSFVELWNFCTVALQNRCLTTDSHSFFHNFLCRFSAPKFLTALELFLLSDRKITFLVALLSLFLPSLLNPGVERTAFRFASRIRSGSTISVPCFIEFFWPRKLEGQKADNLVLKRLYEDSKSCSYGLVNCWMIAFFQ